MVNYLYDLEKIVEAHEAFANKSVTMASGTIRRLVKSELRQRLQNAPASATK